MRGASQRVTNTTLDQEGVFNERLNKLRRSIASYRGYLTRLYKETDELMRNYDNYKEVIKKREDLDKSFANFKEASDNCGRFLIKDKEKEAMASQLDTEIRRYQEFKIKIRYSDWLRKFTRRENRSSETGIPNKFEMQTISRDHAHEAVLQTKDRGDLLHSLTKSDRMADNETAKTTRERDSLYKDSLLRVPSLGKQEYLSNYSTQSPRSKNEGRQWFENESKKSSQSSERSKQSQKLAMSCLKLKHLEEKEELLERQQKLEAEI